MCCYVTVEYGPTLEEVEYLLTMAGFVPPEGPGAWVRHFPPFSRDGIERKVEARLYPTVGEDDRTKVAFKLIPSIGSHTQEDHTRAAYPASFVFKLAEILAERGNGRIMQQAKIGICANYLTAPIAELPDRPLTHEAICVGFQEALSKGIAQEPGPDGN